MDKGISKEATISEYIRNLEAQMQAEEAERACPPDFMSQAEYYGLSDNIHRPAHYAEGRQYEPWKVIVDWDLNYLTGSALKYISRHERKGNPVEDLKKAIRFLEMEIERRATDAS